jgi:hypothetical protein
MAMTLISVLIYGVIGKCIACKLPALQINKFNFPPLRSRNSLAQARTLSSEDKSHKINSTRPGSRMPERASSALLRSRAWQWTVVPVAARARAVSTPMLEEQPVTRTTFPPSLPSRSLSLTISRAVGRASPGPGELIKYFKYFCKNWTFNNRLLGQEVFQ